MQGARYGISLDAIPSQFCAGELEATIVEAFECEDPDVIVIEGQGALSHPAYSTTSFVLRGSRPAGQRTRIFLIILRDSSAVASTRDSIPIVIVLWRGLRL